MSARERIDRALDAIGQWIDEHDQPAPLAPPAEFLVKLPDPRLRDIELTRTEKQNLEERQRRMNMETRRR